MENLSHPADGLYDTSAAELRKAGACQGQSDRFRAMFGRGRVLMTLENVTKARDGFGAHLSIAVKLMNDRERVTVSEAHAFDRVYWPAGNSKVEAKAFMDLLLARAIREGRITA